MPDELIDYMGIVEDAIAHLVVEGSYIHWQHDQNGTQWTSYFNNGYVNRNNG